jgi:uncharacterized HAD superfamily protein
MDNRKRIACDLDGTLTLKGKFPEIYNITPQELWKVYERVKPDVQMIKILNKLYKKGYVIYIFTSRSDLFQRQTKKWLDKNKVKYHHFIMNKPFYDLLIDDKAIRPEEIKLWNSVTP